jgi:hypothetical protein
MAFLNNDDATIIAIILAMLGAKKAAASSSGSVRTGTPTIRRTPGADAYDDDNLKPDADPVGDGLALMARAEQDAASNWAVLFMDHPVSPLTAAALARWAGIESSGNARVVSSLGERGLLQAGPQTVEEGGMPQADWDRLINPSTSNKEHAGIAVRYLDWLWQRAARHVTNPPKDPIDQVWYAKLYHQWPVDVRDGELHGPAIEMARELATRWAADARRMHRLRAANVVAFGTPTP